MAIRLGFGVTCRGKKPTRGPQAAVRGVCAACEGRESIWAMERVKGIEPSYEAWEAAVLPLNYTRIWQLVDVQRVIGLSPRFYR